MALSRDEEERFLAALRGNEGFRASVRREVLTDELLLLPGRVLELDARLTERLDRLTDRVDQLTVRVDQLTDRVDQLTDRVDQLTVGLDRLTDRVDQLTVGLDRLTDRVDQLTVVVSRHQDDLGQLKGSDLERKVRERPGAYLSPVLRKVRMVPEPELAELLADESVDVLRADVVARGNLASDRQPTLAVVEASWRVHSDDVDRALARAQLLARATGQRVLPMALSHDDPGDTVRDKARVLGVALVLASGQPALVEGSPLRAA